MRKGFGILQALMIIVIVSGILVIAMKYATISTKQTSAIYVKEAANIFTKSAIEMSMLAISGFKREKNKCLRGVDIISTDGRFEANVSVAKYFLFKGSEDCEFCKELCSPIKSEDSHGMVMLEVKVKTIAGHPKNRGKKVSIIKRSMQRP